MFEPAQKHYRLCKSCNKATYSIGFTSSKRRTGGADLMHGGHSRLRGDTLRRPLALRGDQGRETILEGFRDFTTDYYGHTAGLSTIFKHAGYDEAALRELSQSQNLNNLLMDFCPAFRQWIHQFAGDKAMELVIEFYGLYGDPSPSQSDLAYNLDIKNFEGYKNWILSKLRGQDAEMALEQLASGAATSILK